MWKRKENSPESSGAEAPVSFTSVEEARNSYESHWNHCLHFFQDVKEQHSHDLTSWKITRRLDLAKKLHRWSVAFAKFLHSSKGKLDSRAFQAAHVLEIQYLIGAMNIDACSRTGLYDEMVWDPYCPVFGRIVFLAQSVIGIERSKKNTSQSEPNFCLDENIVSPLNIVGYRCRHPIIRREAISLLSSSARQEGVWNSIVCAKVCQRVMETEEQGLGIVTRCDDIPHWARVFDVSITFNLQAREVSMQYRRYGSSSSANQEPANEVIDY